MMRATFRSVFLVNRGNLLGAFGIVALATALLTATGSWLQAGWNTEAGDAGLSLLSTLASSFAGTTLIITVFIVASTFSTALRHRRREFALLRSVGATGSQVRNQITAEVLVVVLGAAPIGAVAGVLIAPLPTGLLVSNGIVPPGFVLPFSPLSIIATLALLVPTALLAGRLAARESMRLSPAMAVQQSGTEPLRVSKGRLLAATIVAAAGLVAAATPLFLSGVAGTISGVSSALLLIVAGALAGPAAVAWVATRIARATASGHNPALVLAAVNTRGFSRRNTAVILPLALLLCLGAVQSGTGAASAEAAAIQAEKSVAAADLVVSGADSGSALDLHDLAGIPGVVTSVSTGAVQASVRVEDEDEEFPLLDGFSWETAAVRFLTPLDSGLLDPEVTAGTLADLDDEGTIAVSSDALAFTGKGLGDSIGLQLDGQPRSEVRIVAIYRNSLGVGDYLVSAGAVLDAVPMTVLVKTEDGSDAAVQAALEARGMRVTDARGYAVAARSSSDAEQVLSITLLLALLAFIAIAAFQTLVTTTSGRRAEFDLLRRTGATRPQLAAMVAVESVFVAAAALLLATAAGLPTLIGIGAGLVGHPFAAFDPAILIPLVGVVIVLPIATMISVGWVAMTPPRQP